jgi:hypothetical protein
MGLPISLLEFRPFCSKNELLFLWPFPPKLNKSKLKIFLGFDRNITKIEALDYLAITKAKVQV